MKYAATRTNFNWIIVVSLIILNVGNVHAQVYRCAVNGKLTYQQSPCETSGGKGVVLKLDISPPVTPASAVKRAEAPTPAPVTATPAPQPPTAVSTKSHLEVLSDVCLDWYRPLLRDPKNPYYRDATYEKGVLEFTLYATNGFGGYTSRPAACEFRNGSLEESWTKIQAKRRGWGV